MNRVPRIPTALALLLASVVGSACVRKELVSPDAPSAKLTGTSFFSSGTELFFGVDARASWIGGPRNFFPLLVTIVKREGFEPMYIGRESFLLELPDGTLLPLASYGEYTRDYKRGRVDVQLGGPYLETLSGRFPEPPFHWLPLEFFPLQGSGIIPRETIDLRESQLIYGYLYFRLPAKEPPPEGRCKLLLTPQKHSTTYVVDFPPFVDDTRSRR